MRLRGHDQGSVGELRAAQQPDFIVAPEYDTDLPLLSGLLQEADCTVTQRPAEAAVLAESTRSLERAFFALTGTASADVPADLEMGAIK
jgi:hypothetical protein